QRDWTIPTTPSARCLKSRIRQSQPPPLTKLSLEQVDIALGEYTYLPIERVHFGQGVIDKLGSELDRIGSQRPFVITGHTIASKTDLVVRLEQVARGKLPGFFSEIRQKPPKGGKRLAAKAARKGRADTLV